MFLLDSFIRRLINYAVTPLFSKIIDVLDNGWSRLSPQTRQTIVGVLKHIAVPIYRGVDALRAGLVRAYVTDPKFAASVYAHSGALNSLAFRSSSSQIATSLNAPTKDSTVRIWALPFLAIGLPLFYVADITRTWTVDTEQQPSNEVRADVVVRAIWQDTFGSV